LLKMAKNQKNEDGEAVAFAASGAVVGAATSATLGGMGLAVAGTAVGIGMLPLTIAGAALGMAAYGVKKAMEDQD
jgi:integral membrane sensor domain MASE1